ncbi:Mitotic checkpoint serine/threonine-protein kinase BUB1 [Linum perenne]
MAIMLSESGDSDRDPLLQWLLSIRKALDGRNFVQLEELVSNCIRTFKDDLMYRDDPRFLKIWFLHLECSGDFETVFKEMETSKICIDNSLLYELYAGFLEAKEMWQEAHMVYRIGILRKAEPLERLKNAFFLFLDRMSDRVNACSVKKIDGGVSSQSENCINPWSASTMEKLMKKIQPSLAKYDGYHSSSKTYSGKVDLSSLRNSSRNKMVELGKRKYQIKGCAGQGRFAQVFKAHDSSNPDEIIALKIQTPPFPWEFYVYRQLDQRIPVWQRPCFGLAQRMHLYSDYSILVCDYLSHGTLHDVINSYVVVGKTMEEQLCIYYTIEMLYMLETLHDVGLIHGDFKPDNLLVRCARDQCSLFSFLHVCTQSSIFQGLCLIDWGRAIDLRLFPSNMEFEGACRTSGFRCVEMQENKRWKCQADSYNLCVVVHLMLHGSYMETERKHTSDSGNIIMPRLSVKRYWNCKLWEKLFKQLLNNAPHDDRTLLHDLREEFQEYLCSDPQLLRKLKELLTKQRHSLCSS